MFSTLTLVYPPVSNQEAEWIKSDSEVESIIRTSDFYLVAGRTEVLFEDFEELENQLLRFTVRTRDGLLVDQVTLDGFEFARSVLGIEPDTIQIVLGPKIIQFFDGTDAEVDAGTAKLIEWFTTEKLIFDKSRSKSGIIGLEKFREFGTYDLLYVGIAKKTDTFARLFEGAHHARQKMLSNERPRAEGSIPTDELFLFPIRIDPLIFRTLDDDRDYLPISSHDQETHRKTIVIDAEKAFIKLLEPNYNVEKFAGYPRSKDGLYDHGYKSYGFVLGENLTFKTEKNQIAGSAFTGLNQHYDDADMLMVTGDVVEIRSPKQMP